MSPSKDHEYRAAAMASSTFIVEVDDVPIGRFLEVSGLEVSVEMTEYKEGGVNDHVHQLPGRMTWPNITLKRGVTVDDNLLAWFHKATGEGFASKGKVVRSTAAITLVSRGGTRIRAWNLIDAVPVKWSGPSLAATTQEVPVEELEVAHHGFKATTF